MNELYNFVSSVGFPIAMCLIMVNQNRQLTASFQKQVIEFTEALNKNTRAIQRMATVLLEREENECND